MSASKQISSAGIFNCSDLSSFIDTIIQILPYDGFSKSKFYICEHNGVRFFTKLCFYHKTAPELYDVKGHHGSRKQRLLPQADAEIGILYALKSAVADRGLSPCILEIVYAKVCHPIKWPTKTICRSVLDSDGASPQHDVLRSICSQVDLLHSGLAHDKYAFLVLDNCNISLDEFIAKSNASPVYHLIFKTLLFQIVHAFYAICQVYPKFRHYDLHTNNVMLKFNESYKFSSRNVQYLVFNVGSKQYQIPYFGIIVKIIDFGFSMIPEENLISSNTADKLIMYHRSENDLLLLFHWIYRITGERKQLNVDDLLHALEPNDLYIRYNTVKIRKMEHKIPTYEMMVNNHIWDEYLGKTPLDDKKIFAQYYDA